jgi:hypothetical protein
LRASTSGSVGHPKGHVQAGSQTHRFVGSSLEKPSAALVWQWMMDGLSEWQPLLVIPVSEPIPSLLVFVPVSLITP